MSNNDNQSGAKRTIIDVRSPQEFINGHIPGSINIPLHEIEKRMDEIQHLNQPIVLCCASGGRSEIATQILTSAGIECSNAGSWMSLC